MGDKLRTILMWNSFDNITDTHLEVNHARFNLIYRGGQIVNHSPSFQLENLNLKLPKWIEMNMQMHSTPNSPRPLSCECLVFNELLCLC